MSIKNAFERMSNRCPKKITPPASFLIPNPYYYFLIEFFLDLSHSHADLLRWALYNLSSFLLLL